MATGAEVGEVFGVDSDELKLEFCTFKGNLEIPATEAGLLGDVIFDAVLYVLCYDVRDWLGRSILCVL
jgi:hypothetical protein